MVCQGNYEGKGYYNITVVKVPSVKDLSLLASLAYEQLYIKICEGFLRDQGLGDLI
jgi:hypothetical protein